MFLDDFILNVDLLRKEGAKDLDMSIESGRLQLDHQDAKFGPKVQLKGQAYLVDDRLILNLNVSTHAILPCTICNGEAEKLVEITNLYHVEELKNMKTTLFDFSEILKQEIFLEVPKYAECANGNCPERESMNHYLGVKKPSQGD